MHEELKQYVDGKFAHERAYVANRFDEERELLRAVEISLLTEFHKGAQIYEVRARGTSTVVAL